MRVLLDENLDQALKPLFDESFEVLTVADRGWKGWKNGALLRAAQEDDRFDVLVTRDRNFIHQQNLSKVRLGIVVLRARNSSYAAVARLIPRVNEVIRGIRRGEVVQVSE